MTTTRPAAPPRPRLRPIALPVEHGGWAFLLEPIVLGQLLAPSWAGGLLAAAALGVFLIHQPLKVALKDTAKGIRTPRTAWAWRFAAGYALVAGGGLLGALALAEAPFWPALLAAVPFALAQLALELTGRGRGAAAEIAGAAALQMIAPAMVLAAGGPAATAAVAALLLIGRAAPSILYVRVRLRRARGQAASPAGALLAHGLALASGLLGMAFGAVNSAAVAALALLLGRAAYGLSARAGTPPAKVIGMQEIVFGLVSVALFALALR